MFITWFENLMDITTHCNFETEEVSRSYWDNYHERKRRQWKSNKKEDMTMYALFESFVDNLSSDCLLCVRISDNQLDEENWAVDGLTISNGVVIKQLHLTKGVYTLPDMVSWTTDELIWWTQYDATGRPEEQYHEISKQGVI